MPGLLERAEADVSDDLTDDIVRNVLGGGGEVVVLPEGALTEHQGLALVLRY